jgi:hypothetical protein
VLSLSGRNIAGEGGAAVWRNTLHPEIVSMFVAGLDQEWAARDDGEGRAREQHGRGPGAYSPCRACDVKARALGRGKSLGAPLSCDAMNTMVT